MKVVENDSKRNALKFLLSFLAPFKREILIIFISIIIVSSAILGLGYALRDIIDQGFVKHNVKQLNQAFSVFAIFIFLLALASYNRSIRVNWICEKLESDIKQNAFRNLVNISPSYFETHKISDIFSRLTTDLTILTNSLLLIASYSIRNLLMGFGGLILLFFTSLKLTTYVLLILPLTIIPIITIGRISRKLAKQNQHEVSLANSKIEETLSFIKVVQAYNQQNYEYDNFAKQIDKAQSTAKKRIKARATLFALVIALVLSSIAFVLWIGGQDVLNGKMTAGSLSSFVFYAILVATSIGSLSEVYSDWIRALGSLERINEILVAETLITENIDSNIKIKNTDIQFSNISYSYPSRKEITVLKDISFEVKEGETVALVGPSGSGKSTIFNLMLRFDDADKGKITIGNINIKDFNFVNLRESFALVTQDPVIFSASAIENIKYGKLSASLEEVYNAAKAAEIHDFIMSLPEKYDTFLGEKGMQISGGQKQRIAIARAILANPKILLLDEATSSLDNENEKLVQLALNRLKKDRTTIIISHRLSSITNSDKIILLKNGRIIAQDTHENLIRSSDLYKRLYNDQIDI